MTMGKGFSISGLLAGLLLAVLSARAAAPAAAINASPAAGNAPLGVFFDASSSSPDAQLFLWDFGDGGASTAKSVTHIYTVAGTYTATLTVTNAAGQAASAQIAITVAGNTAGPVSNNVNFRWVVTSGGFALYQGIANRDSLTLVSTFNTVDLPPRLDGLSASFSVNNTFTITGVLGIGYPYSFVNPALYPRPTYSLTLDPAKQLLTVYISRAELKDALAQAPSGVTDATVIKPGIQTPVTFTLTIGAQTYTVTENFAYTAAKGVSGRGVYNLAKEIGSVDEGFFVVSRASALENGDGSGHFFEFQGYLARPAALPVLAPGAGTFVFKFHDADKVVVPFDRLRASYIGATVVKISYSQPDRALGWIRSLTINTLTRSVLIQTWEIPRDSTLGGTGLPIRGQAFLAFNFALRLELDQPDGTTFEVVTATTLTRKTDDDALWQTGRRR
ncbi:MAG: PKD domain-containing protein [Planctomycetota bacterium]